MKLKKLLNRIDIQIKYWEDICKRFPQSEPYKQIIYKLQQQRANEANKIGRAKTKFRGTYD